MRQKRPHAGSWTVRLALSNERLFSPDAKHDRNAALGESNAGANCLPLLNLINQAPAAF